MTRRTSSSARHARRRPSFNRTRVVRASSSRTREKLPARDEDATARRHQVDDRAAHFWGSYAPSDWVAMNKVEWAELHHRLAGREVPVADQLEYFFDAAPAWCGPDPRRE